ncbi:hypothetical protein CHU92_14695 [Flavobacterium cyanobacteriorum]|uniref:PglD N-terminal domain-containing protein n=1 Tax=Flavobacterium cyanobacteriorum TaxID=2022802 RepID=A0A255YSG3_9FLAO|nr:NeuD/PglB/VioB family sugar acetyltransferase [Flavobacterium cyanobacteriorum]OYQ32121.1 hypothetical protein CHU92_14695 [Flavobacterium cyanobacteriorum]
MKDLIIIGAGNVGGYISYNIADFQGYRVLGFLDDNIEKQGKMMYGRTVLGPCSSIDNYIGDTPLHVVIGIANPVAKKKIALLLKDKNVFFPNLIARNVWLSAQVQKGKGIIIYPGVSVNYETQLGDFVIINMNCAIGHNCKIASYATLAPGVNLAGFTQIGETAEIGIGVSTRQGVIIGENAVVGGQSMILNDVPPGTRVMGVPAKAG